MQNPTTVTVRITFVLSPGGDPYAWPPVDIGPATTVETSGGALHIWRGTEHLGSYPLTNIHSWQEIGPEDPR